MHSHASQGYVPLESQTKAIKLYVSVYMCMSQLSISLDYLTYVTISTEYTSAVCVEGPVSCN